MITCTRQPLQQAQRDVDGLHNLSCVAAGLIPEVEGLEQAAQDRQQPGLFLVVVQQPAWSRT